jgi:hypothetical protein
MASVDWPARVFPPISLAELSEAEERLGFELPATLRNLYTLVGNGGYGPAYGLLGLTEGAVNARGLDSVSLYESFRQVDPDDPHWSWPEGLLPIGHLGCGMYACADCTSIEVPIIWFEPNPHCEGESWDDSFLKLTDSVIAWLEAWLDGTADDLFETAWPVHDLEKPNN